MLIYLSGMLTLTVGLAIVLSHNVWVGDWRLIITIFGWLGVGGGVFRILWPQGVVTVGTAIIAHGEALMFGGFAVLVLRRRAGLFRLRRMFRAEARAPAPAQTELRP